MLTFKHENQRVGVVEEKEKEEKEAARSAGCRYRYTDIQIWVMGYGWIEIPFSDGRMTKRDQLNQHLDSHSAFGISLIDQPSRLGLGLGFRIEIHHPDSDSDSDL